MEGPSIVLLKEQARIFAGKKIIQAGGNAKIDCQRLSGEKLMDIKSWGKQFLLCFSGFFVRIHFLMFGSYRINESREMAPRLSLQFKNGYLNFYTCSVKIMEGNAEDAYDWKVDVLSDTWDNRYVKKLLKQHQEEQAGDVLLDQNLFAGVGNIIKNEVLFRIGVHPETLLKNLTKEKIDELVKEARQYSFDFLNWKRDFVLKKHWQIYNKKVCPHCNTPLTKKITGKRERRSFFCPQCQPY